MSGGCSTCRAHGCDGDCANKVALTGEFNRGYDDGSIYGRKRAILECIAAAEAALESFWDEASNGNELGWMEQHDLYVATMRALLEGEK